MKPQINGPHAQAWKYDLDAFREANKTSRADSSVASWVIRAPWANPLWHSYALHLLHLRPLPGFGPPRIFLQGATHEIALFALDPVWKLDLLQMPRHLPTAGVAGGSHQRLVRLQGYRVKLKNRRVYASAGPDQCVWMKWVKLEGKKRKAISIRLTPEAAAATAAAIMDVLKDMMRNGTGKQPNAKLSDPRGTTT